MCGAGVQSLERESQVLRGLAPSQVGDEVGAFFSGCRIFSPEEAAETRRSQL